MSQFVNGFVQDTKAEGKKTEALYENTHPSTYLQENDQADAGENVECKTEIPMVLFSAASPSEEASTGMTDDECDEDCDLFDPADLMKFAWQIARGMVRK